MRPKLNIFRTDEDDKRHKIQSRRMISYYWSRICFRKITGWYRMSNFVGHRCHKILHVKILLLQRIQVGNGQYFSVLFVIPVIIDIHGHRFEIFTLVSEIHDNVDLVMEMENIFEQEGVIDSQDSCFSFLSRLIPFFLVMAVEIAPKMQKMVVVEAPFVGELSGMAIVKILDMKEQATSMIKLKFIRNKAVLKITNNTHKAVTFGQTEMIGVVDLRSLAFYKIKQEVLQEHLGKHYHFKLVDGICNQYNRFVNLMRKEERTFKGKYPWLEDTDERKYMMDREI